MKKYIALFIFFSVVATAALGQFITGNVTANQGVKTNAANAWPVYIVNTQTPAVTNTPTGSATPTKTTTSTATPSPTDIHVYVTNEPTKQVVANASATPEINVDALVLNWPTPVNTSTTPVQEIIVLTSTPSFTPTFTGTLTPTITPTPTNTTGISLSGPLTIAQFLGSNNAVQLFSDGVVTGTGHPFPMVLSDPLGSGNQAGVTNNTPGSGDYAVEVRNIPSGTQAVSQTNQPTLQVVANASATPQINANVFVQNSIAVNLPTSTNTATNTPTGSATPTPTPTATDIHVYVTNVPTLQVVANASATPQINVSGVILSQPNSVTTPLSMLQTDASIRQTTTQTPVPVVFKTTPAVAEFAIETKTFPAVVYHATPQNTLTDGSTSVQQGNAAGNPFFSNWQPNLNTYSAAFSAVAGTGASDTFTFFGSSSKTVAISRIQISGNDTNATFTAVLVRRSTADSGGTAANTPIVCKHDSTFAANSVSLNAYTANPTVGTNAGPIRAFTSGGTVGQNTAIWTFGDRSNAPLILRGTAEGVAIQATGGSTWSADFEWVEY